MKKNKISIILMIFLSLSFVFLKANEAFTSSYQTKSQPKLYIHTLNKTSNEVYETILNYNFKKMFKILKKEKNPYAISFLQAIDYKTKTILIISDPAWLLTNINSIPANILDKTLSILTKKGYNVYTSIYPVLIFNKQKRKYTRKIISLFEAIERLDNPMIKVNKVLAYIKYNTEKKYLGIENFLRNINKNKDICAKLDKHIYFIKKVGGTSYGYMLKRLWYADTNISMFEALKQCKNFNKIKKYFKNVKDDSVTWKDMVKATSNSQKNIPKLIRKLARYVLSSQVTKSFYMAFGGSHGQNIEYTYGNIKVTCSRFFLYRSSKANTDISDYENKVTSIVLPANLEKTINYLKNGSKVNLNTNITMPFIIWAAKQLRKIFPKTIKRPTLGQTALFVSAGLNEALLKNDTKFISNLLNEYLKTLN